MINLWQQLTFKLAIANNWDEGVVKVLVEDNGSCSSGPWLMYNAHSEVVKCIFQLQQEGFLQPH